MSSTIIKDTICEEYHYFHKKNKDLSIAKKKIASIKTTIVKRFDEGKFEDEDGQETKTVEVNDFLFEYVKKKKTRLPPKQKDVPEDVIEPFMEEKEYFNILGDGIDDDDDYEDEIKFIWDEDDIKTTHQEIQDTYDYLESIDEEIYRLFTLYKNKLIDLLQEEVGNKYYYKKEDICFELNKIKRNKFNKGKFMKNKELKKKYGVMSSGSTVLISEY